jgi:hypothetical protein
MICSEPIKHKRGDVREDGMVFWQRFGNNEMWVTPEKFQLKKQAHVLNEKKYRNSHKEKISKRQKQKRIVNGDYIRERERAWWKNNPEKAKVLVKRKYEKQPREIRLAKMRPHLAMRRARKIQQTPVLSEEQKKIIKCFYEQADRLEKRFGLKFHVDHIKPLARGGLHDPKNLQVLPKKINQIKNAHQEFRWAEL